MDDQNPAQLKYDGLTIEGYSRGALQTYWRIPELKLGFDLGGQPWDYMGTPKWFVSHTHLDHILALPAYVARRRMMKMAPPVIYLPEKSVETVREWLGTVCRLDRGRLPCQLVGVVPGQEISLSRELAITVLPTYHSVPSVGYLVWECRRKLKPEYVDLDETAIRQLAMQGTDVSYETRSPRVVYLGDTTIRALDENPVVYEASILIMEMTFVAQQHRQESIAKYGHIHLDDVVERKHRFQNGRVIMSHFSTRYLQREIETTISRRLPDMLGGRLVIWL